MKKPLFILLCFAFFFIGCSNNSFKESCKKTIILSKASSSYVKWIEKEDIIVLDAYTIDNTDSILSIADGIILTGGEDINPLEYNDTINIKVCGPINYSRDTLERKLFDYAFDNKIPLVGVCRGMQMMNVASGGTLYGDIPIEIGTKVIHRNNGEVMHEIAVSYENPYYTNLIFPLDKDTFLVNSWHHQGLKDIAPNIHIIARSYDGLPEAAIIDTVIHPFMIAVQFHPERLGSDNVIHKQMRSSFLNAIYN
ncbi:MAG: gamma-glutamyl-gamma-aminobutyrate hydrolase family protein [Bacteroidota bacterium]|nr:gamma-glutamyl-gamma-aminobutyrate hydrolase family protein [Bacteroidota bacterium]